jgi:SAM-dependent methyltransferase
LNGNKYKHFSELPWSHPPISGYGTIAQPSTCDAASKWVKDQLNNLYRQFERLLRQSRKPSGRFGRFLAWAMNVGHAGLTRWGLDFIEIARDMDVLVIGGGRTVERLASIAADGKVVGIDYSQDAIAVARKKNQKLFDIGRVAILQESVSSMSFCDDAFDFVTAFESH